MPDMGFFDSLRRAGPPAPRQPSRRLPEWFHPGRNVMPTVLPVDRLLTGRPELAVFVSALRVRPSGFEFDVEVLRRLSDTDARDVLDGDPFEHTLPPRRRPGSAEPAGGHVSFGVRYADGRSATADPVLRMPFDAGVPEPPFVKPTGGRGMPGHWHRRYWVWGLPASGDIELVYSWPAENVEETTFTVDGDRVRAAAADAVVLWDEPDAEAGGGDGRVANPAD